MASGPRERAERSGGPDEGGSRAPVRIAATLLAVQSAATVVAAVRLGLHREWGAQMREAPLSALGELARSATGGYALLAALAFGAAAGFLLVRRGAWLYAMILQVLMLGVSLAAHLRGGPAVTYLPMAYGVLMVLYLNSRPVRSILHGDGEDPDDTR